MTSEFFRLGQITEKMEEGLRGTGKATSSAWSTSLSFSTSKSSALTQRGTLWGLCPLNWDWSFSWSQSLEEKSFKVILPGLFKEVPFGCLGGSGLRSSSYWGLLWKELVSLWDSSQMNSRQLSILLANKEIRNGTSSLQGLRKCWQKSWCPLIMPPPLARHLFICWPWLYRSQTVRNHVVTRDTYFKSLSIGSHTTMT